MSHDLYLAQNHAFNLSRTLMIPVTLFEVDGEFGVMPSDELDDADVEVIHEYTVLLHGLRTDVGQVSLAMRAAGLPVYRSLDEAETSIRKDRIGYLPLTAFGSQLYNLAALYRLFEMRSPLNMVVPLLNPLGAKTTVLGVPNASDRKIHRDAAQVLGWPKLTAIGTSRDVAQATPFRLSTLFRLDGSVADEAIIGSTPAPKAEAVAGLSSLDYWRAVWTGAARDDRARAIVVDTAAIALSTLDTKLDLETARQKAASLWEAR